MSTRRILLAALFGCLVEGAALAQTQHLEDEKVSLTTNTTFQDKAVLSFTANASQYLIIETATFAASDTYALHTSPAYTQVQAVVDDVVYSKSNQYSNLGVSGTAGQPFTTWMSFAAHQLVTFTAGSSHTIKIQYSTTNSSYAAQIRNARIVAIPVSTSQNVEQTPLETATDVNTPNCCTYGTGTTVKTLSFTPPSTEDYLVIASAQIATNPSQNGCDYLSMIRLRQGTTDEIPVDPKEEMRYQPKPVGQVYRSYANMRKYSLAGGVPQTFRIQVDARSVTCNGITRHNTFIKDTRITAIPLSAMASGASGYAEVEAQTSTTSSTLQTRVTGSVTVTPSQPYVVLGMSFLKNSARSGSNGRCYQVNGHRDIGGTGAADVGYVCNSTDEYQSFFDMRQVSWPDNLSHSSSVSYDTEAGGIAWIKNARVLMMPVVAASAGGGINPPIPGDIVRVYPSHNATALPFVKYTLSTGTNYTFSTTGGSAGADTVLHLLDPNGTQVGYNDDCGGTLLSKFPCTGSWSPSVAGDYTVMVRAYSPTSSGTVSITQQIGTSTPTSQGPLAFTKPWIDFGGQINGDTVTTVERWGGGDDAATFLALDEWTINQMDDDSGVDRMAEIKATSPASGAFVGGKVTGGAAGAGLTTVYVNDATRTGVPPINCTTLPPNNQDDVDCDGVGNLLEGQNGTCAVEPCVFPGMLGPVAMGKDTDVDGLPDMEELLGVKETAPGAGDALKFPKWGARPKIKDLFIDVNAHAGSWAAKDDPTNVGNRKLWAQQIWNRFSTMPASYNAAPAIKGLRTHIDMGVDDPGDLVPGPLDDRFGFMPRYFNGNTTSDLTLPSGLTCASVPTFLPTQRRGRFVAILIGFFPGGSCVAPTNGPTACCQIVGGYPGVPFNAVHELGHGLNLRHEGGDGSTFQPHGRPNYFSVMNYVFSFASFSLGNMRDLNPTLLDESKGVTPDGSPQIIPADFLTGSHHGYATKRLVDGSGNTTGWAVDWNRNCNSATGGDLCSESSVRANPDWIAPQIAGGFTEIAVDQVTQDRQDLNAVTDVDQAATPIAAAAGASGTAYIFYREFVSSGTAPLKYRSYSAANPDNCPNVPGDCGNLGAAITFEPTVDSGVGAAAVRCDGCTGVTCGGGVCPAGTHILVVYPKTDSGTLKFFRRDLIDLASPVVTDEVALSTVLDPVASPARAQTPSLFRSIRPDGTDERIYMAWVHPETAPVTKVREARLALDGSVAAGPVTTSFYSQTPPAYVVGTTVPTSGPNRSLVFRDDDPASGTNSQLRWADQTGSLDDFSTWSVAGSKFASKSVAYASQDRPMALYNPVRNRTAVEWVAIKEAYRMNPVPSHSFRGWTNDAVSGSPIDFSWILRDIGPNVPSRGGGALTMQANYEVGFEHIIGGSADIVYLRRAADGIANVTLRDFNDWDRIAAQLCSTVAGPTACSMPVITPTPFTDPVQATDESYFLAMDFGHAVGATDFEGWSSTSAGYLASGLLVDQTAGSHSARFQILSDVYSGTTPLATLDVADSTGASLASLTAVGNDFAATGPRQYRIFEVPFSLASTTSVQLRVKNEGSSLVKFWWAGLK